MSPKKVKNIKTLELDSKSRLVASMLHSLRTSGYHGTGISEILQRAKVPKGVLYHHFPEGKAALAALAVTQTGELIGAKLASAFAKPDPFAALQEFLMAAIQRVSESDYRTSCPLARASLDASSADALLQIAAKQAFEFLQNTLTDGFASLGFPPARASMYANLVLSSYEGAMLLAHAHREEELIEQTLLFVIQLIRTDALTLTNSRTEASEAKSARSVPGEPEKTLKPPKSTAKKRAETFEH